MLSKKALLICFFSAICNGSVQDNAEEASQDQLSVLVLFLFLSEILSHLQHVVGKQRCIYWSRNQPDLIEDHQDEEAGVHGDNDGENSAHILLTVLEEREVVESEKSDDWADEPRSDSGTSHQPGQQREDQSSAQVHVIDALIQGLLAIPVADREENQYGC